MLVSVQNFNPLKSLATEHFFTTLRSLFFEVRLNIEHYETCCEDYAR